MRAQGRRATPAHQEGRASHPRPNVAVRFAPSRLPCPPAAPQPREILREVASVGDDTYRRVNALHYGVLENLDTARLQPVLSRLIKSCGLTSSDFQLILVRHPSALTRSLDDVEQVLEFLQQDLGLEGAALRSVVTRYPQIFSYSVKAHLRPQLAYLTSLGVPQDQLREYVVARPLLLGEGISTVIDFLGRCGVPRKQMAALLRSYPIDYCCRFIFTPAETSPENNN